MSEIYCLQNKLSKYKIVVDPNCSVNDKNFANCIRYTVLTRFGCELEIVNDCVPSQDCVILVGNTRNTTVTATPYSFTVSGEKGKLQFVADGMFGYEAMYQYLVKEFFEKLSADDGITQDFTDTGIYPVSSADGSETAVKSYGDVRVMVYNCYGYGGGPGEPEVRQPFQAEMFKTYAPDVIGLQEAKPKYLRGINPILGELGYTWVDTDAKETNCTSMYYRADQVTLIESGYHLFTGPNNSNTKSITWGVFRDRATQRLFAALTTHFMWGDPSYSKEVIAQTRISNATEYADVTDRILEKYPNIPLLGGGDMNCSEEGTPHGVLKERGLLNAWYEAARKNDFTSHIGYAAYDPAHQVYTKWNESTDHPHAYSIDHVYVTPNTEVGSCFILSDLYCRWTSDHLPILVDIVLQ